jgi:hypothetical protein
MGESLTQTNARPAAAHADISNSGRIRTNLQAFMKIRNGRCLALTLKFSELTIYNSASHPGTNHLF